MSGLINPAAAPALQPAPPVPGPDTAAVLAAQRDAEQRRAQAKGRASTYLTDPSTQMDPGPARQPRALGGV